MHDVSTLKQPIESQQDLEDFASEMALAALNVKANDMLGKNGRKIEDLSQKQAIGLAETLQEWVDARWPDLYRVSYVPEVGFALQINKSAAINLSYLGSISAETLSGLASLTYRGNPFARGLVQGFEFSNEDKSVRVRGSRVIVGMEV